MKTAALCLALLAIASAVPGRAAENPPPTMMQVPAPAPAPPPAAAAVPPSTTTAPTAAPAPAPVPASAPARGTAGPFPPMNFTASVAGDELFQKVKAAPAFARLDRELFGSPIQVRVTHTLQPTAGGQATGLLSAIWAGSTLGLLPVVTNNSFVLQYEVTVNGKAVTRYEFQRSFTRAINIWSNQNDPTHGLGAEGLEWAESTATEFAAKAAQDPALLALAQEYAFYFGAEAH